MNLRTFQRQARSVTLLLAFSFAVLASAQSPSASSSSGPNNDWLAQAAKMYYSSAHAGLKGFDCEVRPDWQALYAAKNGGQVSAVDQPKLALLSAVKLALHARMENGSILDWNPPNQTLDAGQTELLKSMQSGMNQMLQGFVEFWTPFIERQVIPDSSSGLEMAVTDDGGRKAHVKTADVEVFETFDSGRILRQYNVVMSGAKIEVTPAYSPSDHGLVISHFHAVIHPTGETQKVQEMNVDITYQWLNGFPIPAHLNMDVAGAAEVNTTFENCTVLR